MEKVLQRARYAERQAAKRLQKRRQYLEHTEAWQRSKTAQRMQQVYSQNIVAARKNRQLDWELGPLAPRRDVGDKAATYASLAVYDLAQPEVGTAEQPEFFPVSEGDRVVLLQGRDRGKIGEVGEIRRESNSVRVNGLNVVDVEVPGWMEQQESDVGKTTSVSRPVPIQDLRLIYPLPDPETGVPRDVVIDKLAFFHRPRRHRDNSDDPHKYDRYIPGTNTVIPWPESAPVEHTTYAIDTPRMLLEDRSFRPYLLAAPMPLSVIDELRNKYSKFRTRYDAEYVERKEAEAERELRRKQLGVTMRTPLQELAEVRARVKREQERELSDEQLAKIGQIIEREEKKTMELVKEGPEEQENR